MYPPINHWFDPKIVRIGSLDNPTCYICVNCSVTGIPLPVVTWENQYNSTSDFSCIITNQSNASSPYFLEDNGQVSIILLLAFCYYLSYRSYVTMILEIFIQLMVITIGVLLLTLVDSYMEWLKLQSVSLDILTCL